MKHHLIKANVKFLVHVKKDRNTYSCWDFNSLCGKLVRLLHHSCGEVSHNADLVHVAVTINLQVRITDTLYDNIHQIKHVLFV